MHQTEYVRNVPLIHAGMIIQPHGNCCVFVYNGLIVCCGVACVNHRYIFRCGPTNEMVRIY